MQHFTQTITSDTFERFNNPLTIQVEEQGPCCSAKAKIGAQEPCVCHLKPSTHRDQWEWLIRDAKRNGDKLLTAPWWGRPDYMSPWPDHEECPAPPSPAETPPAPSTLSPWPSLDESEIQESPTHTDPRVLFEQASAAFDLAKPREEGWAKDAPSKFDYTGKRNKKGMPDKRTAAGKAWFQQQREEELKTALSKVLKRHSSSKKD